MRRIKVLHIGKYFPPVAGGVEYALYNLVEATAGDLDNTVLVADPGLGCSDTRAASGYRVIRRRERWNLFYNSVIPSLPLFLSRLRERERFDAIVLHFPNAMGSVAYAVSSLLSRARERFLVFYHADVLLTGLAGFAYGIFSSLDRALLRRADAIVATSPNMVRFSSALRRHASKCRVVPLMIGDDWPATSPEEVVEAERIRREYGDRIALFVGRLVPYKGLDVLLAAAPAIEGRILIVGNGLQKGELERAIQERNLQGKVSLLGKIGNLKPYYLSCDLFVLPSISALEAFGLVQIEAMAFGKPVVSTDLRTGVTFANIDGTTGLVVPVGDATALAAAVNRLLGDRDLRESLGGNARERVLSEFVRSRVGPRFTGVIEDLVAACGSKPGGRRDL